MRLIDADALPQYYEVPEPKKLKDVLHSYKWWFVKGITSVTDSIDNASTIDPVKHGYWHAFTPLAQPRYVCSECFATGKYHIWSDVDGLEYCPRCGARMEGTDDDVGNS